MLKNPFADAMNYGKTTEQKIGEKNINHDTDFSVSLHP
jgi:hypothetical protein